ncbi:hypothetical protein TorRG33x02_138220 [Trema orientale]|uniref:Uncharacterized protein n=1 Tax=Trema orientale TaxID=63057 RepID=A0A2P5EXU8_TREOI|nr:hypothetical protein TorRG33x02_138220 [Trema orientale]
MSSLVKKSARLAKVKKLERAKMSNEQSMFLARLYPTEVDRDESSHLFFSSIMLTLLEWLFLLSPNGWLILANLRILYPKLGMNGPIPEEEKDDGAAKKLVKNEKTITELEIKRDDFKEKLDNTIVQLKELDQAKETTDKAEKQATAAEQKLLRGIQCFESFMHLGGIYCLVYILWCKHNNFDFTIFDNKALQLLTSFMPLEEEENGTDKLVVEDQPGVDAVDAEPSGKKNVEGN